MAVTAEDGDLARRLLETDVVYFEAGADVLEVDGGRLVSLPGLTHLAGGCLVVDVAPLAVAHPLRWLEGVEALMLERGARWYRIYLRKDAASFSSALVGRGYRRREEVAWLASCALPEAGGDVALRRVRHAEDWEAKRDYHARQPDGPAQYPIDADDWLEFDRRKCGSGRMRSYLIEAEGRVCGSVGAIDHGPVIRLKTLSVLPDRRRRGIATQGLHLLSIVEGTEWGRTAIGAFAAAGGPGHQLYRALGMRPVGRLIEWSRPSQLP